MIDLTAFGSTILGGLIAGGSGLVAQAAAIRVRRNREEERWKSRLLRLCRRIHFEGRAASQSPHEIRRFMYAYADVQPLLEDHLASAPPDTPDEVFERYEELAKLKLRLGLDFQDVENAGEETIRAIRSHTAAIINIYNE